MPTTLRGELVTVRVQQIKLGDGRLIEFADTEGPAEAVLVYHHGTPGCGSAPDYLVRLARQRRLRLVTISRPGYASSSRHEGRSVADAVGDCVAVLDFISVERAYVAGASGGGPHALACAALAPDRFLAALIAAGLAPYDAEGFDFLAGMGEANIIEFAATLESEATLRALLEQEASEWKGGTVADVISSWHTMLPDVDQAVISGELAREFMDSIRQGLSLTVDGWIDDNMAFTGPWRFDVGDIQIPTTLWHGGADLMVPLSHGQWLSEHIPRASVHLIPNEGHMSLRVARMSDMLDELLSLA